MRAVNFCRYYLLLTRTAEINMLKAALYMTLMTLGVSAAALGIINIAFDFEDGPNWMRPVPILTLFFIVVVLAPALETALLVMFVKVGQYVQLGALTIAALFALGMACLHAEDTAHGLIVTLPFFIWTYFYASTRDQLPDRAWKIIFFSHAIHNAVIVAMMAAALVFA